MHATMVHMKRVQIQFTDELAHELEEHSQASGQPVAELVRRAVVQMLAEDERRLRWDRALAAIGGFHSGRGDIAENHDDYLNEGSRW
jgi:Arc/MetJ-type ribon-helix-helix transcriptional regulator